MSLDPSSIFNGVVLAALVGLVTDHFRVRTALSDMRLHIAENFASNKDAEKIEQTLTSVVERLDKMVVQLARMEGAMGVQQAP